MELESVPFIVDSICSLHVDNDEAVEINEFLVELSLQAFSSPTKINLKLLRIILVEDILKIGHKIMTAHISLSSDC